MCGVRFNTSLKVCFQELDALFMIQEPIFVKLIHLLTQLDQYVNLTGLRIERELCIRYFDNTSLHLLILFIVKSTHCESDSHIFYETVLVDSLTV